IVGVESVMAEAELMSMAFELFQTLNLEITIQYNNRKLLNGILQAINIPTELTSDVILSLDKIEKIGIDGVRKDVLERGISEEMADTIC
ncbi:histidine--tRNA ligase, partial [Bacillus cereus]